MPTPPPPPIKHLEPTPLIGAWDRDLPSTGQPRPSSSSSSSTAPQTFYDAMAVREAVFVREQGVPQAFEVDDDDPRSCHWVVYDAAAAAAETAPVAMVPVGTIRLVPFPHESHPRPGGRYVDGQLVGVGVGVDGEAEEVLSLSEEEGEEKAEGRDRATDLHDGMEPYVKLGRLAVVREFRGRKLARLLVRTALEWMRLHPDYFDDPVDGGKDGEARVLRRWRGLVCCHAQKAVAGWWEACGFTVDRGMGEWLEEGILHVGMFRRLEVDLNQRKA